MSRLNSALFRGRFLITGAFLLITLYFAVFTWAVPEFGVTFTWLGSKLHVTKVDSLLRTETPFQEGDIVRAIDDVPIVRDRLLARDFSQPSYTFDVFRGEEMLSFAAQVDPTAPRRVEIQTYVASFLLWLLGALTLVFARHPNRDAIYLGIICQVAGVIAVSANPVIWGAPGAWVMIYIGYPLCALFAVLLAYFPLDATDWRSSSLLKAFLLLSLTLATLNLVEFAFLTPRGLSLSDRLEFSLGSISLVAIALGVLANVLVLIRRLVGRKASLYARQQAKVLLFFSLFGLVPFVAFAVLPAIVRAFLPTTLGLMFLLFSPIGYFYVTFRRGYLKLDLVFSRVVTVALLVTCAVLAYSAFLGVAERVYPSLYERLIFNQTMLAIFTVGVVVTGQRLAGSFVEDLLFGKSWIDHDQLFDVTVHLSRNPEQETLQETLDSVAATLDVAQAAIVQKANARFEIIAGVGVTELAVELDTLGAPEHVLLRASRKDGFTELPEWIELVAPIRIQDEMLGFLMLSRPRGGYYNARQVGSVEELVHVLAVNMQVMNLVQATIELSNQLVLVRQIERHQLAAALHNESLQDLSIIAMKLEMAMSDEEILVASEDLRDVSRKLRRIVAGLRPTTVNKSVEWMTREILSDFQLQQPQVRVNLDVSVAGEEIPSEMATWAFHDVLKEALNNVRKHARATRIDVSARCSERGLSLKVTDNGVGAQFGQATLNDLLRKRHFGLAEMHQWALIAGGRLEIRGVQPAGTAVQLWLPLHEELTFAALNGLGYRVKEAFTPYEAVLQKNGVKHE